MASQERIAVLDFETAVTCMKDSLARGQKPLLVCAPEGEEVNRVLGALDELLRELPEPSAIITVTDSNNGVGTGLLAFDAATGHLAVRGRVRRLGTRQARLLQLLIENAGNVIGVTHAAKTVFGKSGDEQIAALRVHIHNLRKKIEEDPNNPRRLVTVPSKGYLFVRPSRGASVVLMPALTLASSRASP